MNLACVFALIYCFVRQKKIDQETQQDKTPHQHAAKMVHVTQPAFLAPTGSPRKVRMRDVLLSRAPISTSLLFFPFPSTSFLFLPFRFFLHFITPLSSCSSSHPSPLSSSLSSSPLSFLPFLFFYVPTLQFLFPLSLSLHTYNSYTHPF